MNNRSDSPYRSFTPSQFTPRAEESFYAVVDSPDFSEMDARLIYQALQERLEVIPFGDYLKRYICRSAKINRPFREVPLAEYQDIMLESFASHDVPATFRPSTIRIRSAAKNWLTQQTVRREAVLLIGFGLKMTRKDVEELLSKGLREPYLNMRDAREYLCAYCYEHGLGFHKYESLMADAEALAEKPGAASADAVQAPENIRDENELLRNAAGLINRRQASCDGNPEIQMFRHLYRQAQETTANILNTTEQDRALRQSRSIEKELTDSDQFFDYQKQHRILKARKPAHRWTPEEITPGDIEHVLQAAIPRDEYDNLLPMKKSALNARFRGRQMTRQRLEKVLSNDFPVSRYDIIMLQFYVYSQKKRNALSRHEYYREFVEQTNECLAQSGMSPLYSANPFECFLMMCILSDEPLSTYSDVIERSYKEANA